MLNYVSLNQLELIVFLDKVMQHLTKCVSELAFFRFAKSGQKYGCI